MNSRILTILLLFLFEATGSAIKGQDTASQYSFSYKGQATAWINVSNSGGSEFWTGLRYLPQINNSMRIPQSHKLDLEASLNLNGAAPLYNSVDAEGSLKPYRLWLRYSGNQYEIRVGLQKINFGSASIFRPLMWFDQMDPRDPLQFTTGVWALLGRYYFLNNANIWLWGLYGNKETKTWELGTTSNRFPEFGGRIQFPAGKGETACTYHFREADLPYTGDGLPPENNIPEHRIGLDGKWDVGIGIWYEGTWTHKSKTSVRSPSDQKVLTLGSDYTLAIGNGMNIIAEHMVYVWGNELASIKNRYHFSSVSASYPFDINDFANLIIYYDWTNQKPYNYFNWKHSFRHFDFYTMLFWNPDTFNLPQQRNESGLFAGKGVQLMLVYNH